VGVGGWWGWGGGLRVVGVGGWGGGGVCCWLVVFRLWGGVGLWVWFLCLLVVLVCGSRVCFFGAKGSLAGWGVALLFVVFCLSVSWLFGWLVGGAVVVASVLIVFFGLWWSFQGLVGSWFVFFVVSCFAWWGLVFVFFSVGFFLVLVGAGWFWCGVCAAVFWGGGNEGFAPVGCGEVWPCGARGLLRGWGGGGRGTLGCGVLFRAVGSSGAGGLGGLRGGGG